MQRHHVQSKVARESSPQWSGRKLESQVCHKSLHGLGKSWSFSFFKLRTVNSLQNHSEDLSELMYVKSAFHTVQMLVIAIQTIGQSQKHLYYKTVSVNEYNFSKWAKDLNKKFTEKDEQMDIYYKKIFKLPNI